eukprot:4115832-Amphidinium_carterae.1
MPASQSHVTEPHVSDRVVAVNTRTMCATEHMGAMPIKDARTPESPLRCVFARQIRRDEWDPKAHAHAQTKDLRWDEFSCR